MTQELDRAEGLRLLDELDLLTAEMMACREAHSVRFHRAKDEREQCAERLSRFLLTHARALLCDGWRGIETAPKMERVLAAWLIGKTWIMQPCLQSESGNWLVAWDSDIVEPTHWQPLPPPPQTEQT